MMLVPQSLAYASIAGLPPIYGLYTAWLPLIIYALLGTSKQLYRSRHPRQPVGNIISALVVAVVITSSNCEARRLAWQLPTCPTSRAPSRSLTFSPSWSAPAGSRYGVDVLF